MPTPTVPQTTFNRLAYCTCWHPLTEHRAVQNVIDDRMGRKQSGYTECLAPRCRCHRLEVTELRQWLRRWRREQTQPLEAVAP